MSLLQVVSDSQREYNDNDINSSESSTHSVLVIYALNVGDRYPLNPWSSVAVCMSIRRLVCPRIPFSMFPLWILRHLELTGFECSSTRMATATSTPTKTTTCTSRLFESLSFLRLRPQDKALSSGLCCSVCSYSGYSKLHTCFFQFWCHAFHSSPFLLILEKLSACIEFLLVLSRRVPNTHLYQLTEK